MTRIVAGAAKGRRLTVPTRGTRPTSDRAREALFSSVGDVEGLAVLDLYAGSGAVGLEALSRGASVVTLVEQDRSAVDAITSNAQVVALPGWFVERTRAEVLLGRPNPRPPYDLVFADPPYDVPTQTLHPILSDLLAHAWCRPGAVVVVERSARDPWTWPVGFVGERGRRYGEAMLWYGRAAG